jgi:DNA (cytosine-5)-methyltransferase 1
MSEKPLTYISLFSGAGIGCFGFKQENFECVATVEILEKRLKFQYFNKKCRFETGYISDDLRLETTKQDVRNQLERWRRDFGVDDLDVLVATPPCQGMSVANHKKKDEKGRNSLVVESIQMVADLMPRFFVFENVRAFLTTSCTDRDGHDRKIKQVIETTLAGDYNIHYCVINFKDYGCPSSRTRTLVLGVRKDLWEVTPLDVFPDRVPEKTLKETIGHLPSLKWGEISTTDIFHAFREYPVEMRSWIAELREGESAFDNSDIEKIPHRKENGLIIFNTNKNGDKYKRQYWGKVAPCIHTRNDILASQNTVHPVDDRVFSIRELALMMSVPPEFAFASRPDSELNNEQELWKRKFLAQEEMNIRQCLGEAVPTIIFRQIAAKIKSAVRNRALSEQEIKKLIEDQQLSESNKLSRFLEVSIRKYTYPTLAKIAELANSVRTENAAFYTRQDICYTIVKDLPDFKSAKTLRILEPSVGVGAFLPLLFKKYAAIPHVEIDLIDIDSNSLDILRLLLNSLEVPKNFKLNFINADFLLHETDETYDIVIGNPPFKRISGEKHLLQQYKKGLRNQETSNIFSFFIEKSVKCGRFVALIVPKSLVNAPEFDRTRHLLGEFTFRKINDYGEKGFRGVLIETISFIIDTQTPAKKSHIVEVESYFLRKIYYQQQNYIFSDEFPYWLLYRDEFFDKIAAKLKFNIFLSFRDRQITKKITKESGSIRVLKSRNIGSNEILDIKGYDCYIDDVDELVVGKFLNHSDAVLVPNLTYYPRACFMPKDAITDGSVAILTLRNGSRKITEADLEYYATEEFKRFYATARNHGTRSLNIDNNSVFFFGIAKLPNS